MSTSSISDKPEPTKSLERMIRVNTTTTFTTFAHGERDQATHTRTTIEPSAGEVALDWGQFAKHTQHALACIQAMAKFYQLMPAHTHVGSLDEAGVLAEQTLAQAQHVSNIELLRVTAILLNPHGLDFGSLSLALAHRHYARDADFAAEIDAVRRTYRLPPMPAASGLSQAKAAMRPWLDPLIGKDRGRAVWPGSQTAPVTSLRPVTCQPTPGGAPHHTTK